METNDLERYRRLTAQYPSFVGLTYLPIALFIAGLAFVNPDASTRLQFFGFWLVAVPLLVLLRHRIVRWYRERFGRVRARPEQRRRDRWVTGGVVVAILALMVSSGYFPWDQRLEIQLAHVGFAIILVGLWWMGDFARDRLHLPLAALALLGLAFVDHSLFVLGPYDLVPDTEAGPGLVDAVVLAGVAYFDHRWLVRRMESLGGNGLGAGRSEAETSP